MSHHISWNTTETKQTRTTGSFCLELLALSPLFVELSKDQTLASQTSLHSLLPCLPKKWHLFWDYLAHPSKGAGSLCTLDYSHSWLGTDWQRHGWHSVPTASRPQSIMHTNILTQARWSCPMGRNSKKKSYNYTITIMVILQNMQPSFNGTKTTTYALEMYLLGNVEKYWFSR